jgi:predicted transposase/invertase (TIGR01784 family)
MNLSLKIPHQRQKTKLNKIRKMNNIVKESQIHKAHDRTFKAAMSDLRVARDFLTHHLPVTVKDKIDLNTLQLCKESFVDPELRELITDMLYSADFKTQQDTTEKAFLYLCLEHQHVPDPLMAWRMIKYTCRMIDHHLTQTEGIELPVVIPIVLYNGDSAYPYSTEVFDLCGENKELAQQWMFNRFQLIDLNQVSDETIRQHQWSGLMEMLMKHVYARDIMVYLEQISGLVRHLAQSKADDYLFSMIKYLIEKSEIHDRDAFHQWVQLHLSPPLEAKTMTTLAEQWKAEGREEGALIGERRLLTTLLNRRFAHLAKNYQDKINQADEKTLQLWGEKILDAKAINDVFEE